VPRSAVSAQADDPAPLGPSGDPAFAAEVRPADHSREVARHWPHPAVPGVDLLRARYVEHTFSRHAHEGYAIGVIETGAEQFAYRGVVHQAAPGSVLMLNPEEPHDGRSATEDGWSYRMLYPAQDVLAEVGAEIVTLRGRVHFPQAVVADPRGAELVVAASMAAERADRLAASTLARLAFGHLIRAHGGSAPARRIAPARRTAVVAAREVLHHRLADPPSMGELAELVGTGPFPLLRAFRAQFGLPPHAYLVQLRVRLAARLLAAGRPPADVAAELGFSDQAHLTRHFKRILGVTPAAYARERRNVQDLVVPAP
jgi:AraC-like DNA-binding protein